MAVTLVVLWALAAADPGALISRGNEAYREGRFRVALELYREAGRAAPDSAEAWFDQGDALYRLGDWSAAEQAFGEAVKRARTKGLIAAARFNQGNSTLRWARQVVDKDPGQALAHLKRSGSQYEACLAVRPGFGGAFANLAVVRQMIEQIHDRERRERYAGKPGKPEPKTEEKVEEAGAVAAEEGRTAAPRVRVRRGAEKDW